MLPPAAIQVLKEYLPKSTFFIHYRNKTACCQTELPSRMFEVKFKQLSTFFRHLTTILRCVLSTIWLVIANKNIRPLRIFIILP